MVVNMHVARTINFAGEPLILDAARVLYAPERKALIVSDLHLEKGSYLATHGGHVLPGLDTRDTLQRLAAAMQHYQPQTVICLGDSFHDRLAEWRMQAEDKQALMRLCATVPDWVWVLGNHDPELPESLPGRSVTHQNWHDILLVHEPEAVQRPQIIGHYHPKISLRIKGYKLAGPCFCQSDHLLIMPAFGSYTGGLSVTDSAIQSLYGEAATTYHLSYRNKLWSIPDTGQTNSMVNLRTR